MRQIDREERAKKFVRGVFAKWYAFREDVEASQPSHLGTLPLKAYLAGSAMIMEAEGGGPIAAAREVGNADPLIRAARSGDKDARTVLYGLISACLARQEPLPDNLRRYNDDCLSGDLEALPKQLGAPASNNIFRDRIIVSMVISLTKKGFKASRSSGGRESACSIVAAVLRERGEKITEDAVAKIWLRYRRNPHSRAGLEAAADRPRPTLDEHLARLRRKLLTMPTKAPSEKPS